MALDIDSFKEEEVTPAKLQKHIRELSEQLYRNVRLHANNYNYISSLFFPHRIDVLILACSTCVLLCILSVSSCVSY